MSLGGLRLYIALMAMQLMELHALAKITQLNASSNHDIHVTVPIKTALAATIPMQNIGVADAIPDERERFDKIC